MSEEKPRKRWILVVAAIIASFVAMIASYVGVDAKRQVEALKDRNEVLQRDIVAAREALKDCKPPSLVEAKEKSSKSVPSAPAIDVQGASDPSIGTNKAVPGELTQEIDDIAITITRVHLSGDVLTFDFQVLNRAPGDKEINLFGEGSFGYGGSRFISEGQEFAATGIRVGNETEKGIVGKRFVSGVPLNGYVAFKGVPGTLRSVAVLELAYSYSNLRPAGTFRFSNLVVE